MEEKIKCIYGIKDKRNDNVIYIGQTRNYKLRHTYHFHTNMKDNEIDAYLKENGRDNFEMFIIEQFNDDITNQEMRFLEQFYIFKYKTDTKYNKIASISRKSLLFQRLEKFFSKR